MDLTSNEIEHFRNNRKLRFCPDCERQNVAQVIFFFFCNRHFLNGTLIVNVFAPAPVFSKEGI
jgi:hypothetical protein